MTGDGERGGDGRGGGDVRGTGHGDAGEEEVTGDGDDVDTVEERGKDAGDGSGDLDDVVPDHVRGRCDIGGCDALANWAYDDGETYLEVCDDHARNLGSQFDSDYDRVAHDSPYRDEDPRDEIPHDCGGTILVFGTADGEYRVCTGCTYAMLLEGGDDEDDAVSVTYTDAVEGSG